MSQIITNLTRQTSGPVFRDATNDRECAALKKNIDVLLHNLAFLRSRPESGPGIAQAAEIADKLQAIANRLEEIMFEDAQRNGNPEELN